MKHLLVLTALIEVPAGLALIGLPGVVVEMLLSGKLSDIGLALGRLTGFALLALGVACWLARNDARRQSARSLVTAVGLYNFGAVAILGSAAVQRPPAGIAAWPVIIVHSALFAWCLICLRMPGDRTPLAEQAEP